MLFLLYSIFVDTVLRDLRTFVIDFAGMKAGEKILDIGCGTGDQAFHYARKGLIVSGIDPNPGMIKVAKWHKSKNRIDNVFFYIASALNLPFPDNSLDYASISLVLHERERRERDIIVNEMKRVVKKGGILILVDFQVPVPGNVFGYFIQ